MLQGLVVNVKVVAMECCMKTIYFVILAFFLLGCGGSDDDSSSQPKITQETINNGQFNGVWFERSLNSYGEPYNPITFQIEGRERIKNIELYNDLSIKYEHPDWDGTLFEYSNTEIKLVSPPYTGVITVVNDNLWLQADGISEKTTPYLKKWSPEILLGTWEGHYTHSYGDLTEHYSSKLSCDDNLNCTATLSGPQNISIQIALSNIDDLGVFSGSYLSDNNLAPYGDVNIMTDKDGKILYLQFCSNALSCRYSYLTKR